MGIVVAVLCFSASTVISTFSSILGVIVVFAVVVVRGMLTNGQQVWLSLCSLFLIVILCLVFLLRFGLFFVIRFIGGIIWIVLLLVLTITFLGC